MSKFPFSGAPNAWRLCRFFPINRATAKVIMPGALYPPDISRVKAAASADGKGEPGSLIHPYFCAHCFPLKNGGGELQNLPERLGG